ncbi:MAG: hypothetical protein V5B31_08410 [Candidatus Accumulibacter propinquus]|uniref:hypothetical protein n=1 Tax=Candidatus Accumulibacter propinquus TaxID=2954380 RepID=UPI002FC28C4D
MNIEPLLDQLRAVSNDALLAALRDHELVIATDKFATAFQCVAACHELSMMEARSGGPPGIPDLALRGGRLRAGVVFMVFTTLCHMRSEHLERGLDAVLLDSALRPFRDIYRAGCMKLGEDTLVQHIRNSMAHGSFQLRKAYEVQFVDRSWRETLPVPHLLELCEHVHRLYHEAFSERVPRPPHWSKYGRISI